MVTDGSGRGEETNDTEKEKPSRPPLVHVTENIARTGATSSAENNDEKQEKENLKKKKRGTRRGRRRGRGKDREGKKMVMEGQE